MPRAREKYTAVATPHKTPMKIPLNDDRQEKANRLQNRQALHEIQMNQIKKAATPVRKRVSLAGGSPRTPASRQDDGDVDMPLVGGNAVTPMKRVPILANFEEWMKLATDNKINAANSWNFALIDYFHDMSLLKEGDGVNFQRASCTLDGCVKIYTSRVDSVATETGRLLSGLADSGNKRRKGEGDEGEAGEDGVADDDDEEGEDGTKKRKKRAQRSSEVTLASSFAQLQLKKMELEFSVDPLFKKASADFDEGGAKGLLLNHLAIDGKGRIVFDSSDDAQDASAQDSRDTPAPEAAPTHDESQTEAEEVEIDISNLAAKYLPDLHLLDEQDICPSLKEFELGDADGSLDLPMLKAPEDWRQQNKSEEDDDAGEKSGIFLDEENAMGFEDDDDGGLAGLDLVANAGFGEGGEIWAKEAALEPQMRVYAAKHGEVEEDGGAGEDLDDFNPGNAQYAVSLNHKAGDDHANILNYFDQTLQKNWAGPEHWRIRRIKDTTKQATTPASKRKEREPFEIDFSAPLTQVLADALYVPATSSSTISLPKAQWKSRTRNLLPDDKHFNSRQLLRLFLKPKVRMGSRKSTKTNQAIAGRAEEIAEGELDEAYWARKESEAAENLETNDAAQGTYDANFFQDDGLGLPGAMDDDDDDFADAREHFSPPVEGGEAGQANTTNLAAGAQEGAFGAQLITQSRRLRPEYVQYARVAKKVDVRRLKEELWRGTGFEETTLVHDTTVQSAVPAPKEPDTTLKFTDMINNLQTVYPKQAMADISTSYCFICLLHLANEKGLVITNESNFENLSVKRDLTADLSVGAD